MSSGKKERGICELYANDPDRADELVFGRRVDKTRRGFLKRSGLAAMATAVGAAIPYERFMPGGLIPAAFAETTDAFFIEGKDGLVVLNDRPLNAETPAHLLDDDVTPIERHFIRNNGIPPKSTDAAGWTIEVDGKVNTPLSLTIDDLKNQFEVVSLKLQIECGGNGRSSFNPPARGNQWSIGAIANSEWTGVRYADVLRAAGVKSSAMYIGQYGADTHLSGQAGKFALSRGMPIDKAMDPHNLIAFEMNGQPIHPLNGAPVRTVVPGWPGSCSQKWLQRIWVRDVAHDGAKMTGKSYRVPMYPVAPGQKVPEEDLKIIESMPVKSLITFPESGIELAPGTRKVEVRGHAWAGDLAVKSLDVSIDFGATWMRAHLHAPPNPFSWQRWRATIKLPQAGYYEVWARATDTQGNQQPFAIAWNSKGYLNNSLHRIALRIPA